MASHRATTFLPLGILLLAGLFLTGCSKADPKAQVAGTYEMDKTAMKEAMQAEIDKIEDPGEKMGAGMMMGMLDAMSITMMLNADGTMNMTMSGMGNEDSISGTWTLDGDAITVVAAKEGEEPEPASGTVSGDTITISPPEGEDMPFDLVFKKKKQ